MSNGPLFKNFKWLFFVPHRIPFMHCMKVARCLRSVVKPTHCPRTSFSLTIEERPKNILRCGRKPAWWGNVFLGSAICWQFRDCCWGTVWALWAGLVEVGKVRAAELQDEEDTVEGRPLLSVQQGCSFYLFLTLGCLQQRHQKSRFLSHSRAYPIAVGVCAQTQGRGWSKTTTGVGNQKCPWIFKTSGHGSRFRKQVYNKLSISGASKLSLKSLI